MSTNSKFGKKPFTRGKAKTGVTWNGLWDRPMSLVKEVGRMAAQALATFVSAGAAPVGWVFKAFGLGEEVKHIDVTKHFVSPPTAEFRFTLPRPMYMELDGYRYRKVVGLMGVTVHGEPRRLGKRNMSRQVKLVCGQWHINCTLGMVIQESQKLWTQFIRRRRMQQRGEKVPDRVEDGVNAFFMGLEMR